MTTRLYYQMARSKMDRWMEWNVTGNPKNESFQTFDVGDEDKLFRLAILA